MKASRPPHPSSLTGDRFRGFHRNEISNWKKTHVMSVTSPMEIPDVMPIKHTNYRAQVRVKANLLYHLLHLTTSTWHNNRLRNQGAAGYCLGVSSLMSPSGPLSRRTGCLSIQHTTIVNSHKTNINAVVDPPPETPRRDNVRQPHSRSSPCSPPPFVFVPSQA
ncbi:hypothetical protein V2G26_017805 [Clonostachys chloroleuca]